MKMLPLLLLCAAFPASARADAIDDYISAEMGRQKVPGLSLAIMREGQAVRAQGYGFANLEHSVPVHPDTLFKTGAIGMQFTAIAVMFLVEDGKIRLDDSIRKHLPNVPRNWAPITIRQLLNHTSGLPVTPNGDFRVDYTDDQLLDIIGKQELNFPAGTRWHFSYADYVVLGILVNKVSGELHTNLLARRLFKPLNMNTARLIDEGVVIPNRATGYDMRDGVFRNAEWVSQTANSGGDGPLYLSALDVVNWDAGLLKGSFLKPQSWAEMARPAQTANGSTYPYGFGWYREHTAGQDIWYHGGSWMGFQAFIIRYLGDKLTVVVMANGEKSDPEKIARHVAGMLDSEFAQAPAAPIEDREPQVTAALKRLLQQIAAGKADYNAFAFVSKAEFAETMVGYGPGTGYQAFVQPLGALQAVSLFACKEVGEDRVYHYRARYERGLLEARIGYAPNGKIGSFELVPISEWDEPVRR